MKNILVGVTIIMFFWLLAFYLRLTSPGILPSPVITFSTLFELLKEGEIFGDMANTLSRWAIGFGGGIITGIPLGLILGMSKKLREIFEFPVDFFRSLPVTALFPIFLLAFGLGNEPKVAMVWVGVMLIILVNSMYGVLQSSKERVRMATVFGASKWQIFKFVTVRESLPQTMVGLRIGLSASLIIIILSEMFIGTKSGLGQLMYDMYSRGAVEHVYAVLIIIGVLGYLLNKAFLKIESRLIYWAGK